MRAYANKYNVQKGRNFDDERDYLLPFLRVSVIRVTISLHRIQNTKKVDINNRYIKG